MPLTLKVLTFKGQPIPVDKILVIDDHDATIGRSESNGLVLPDPEKFVSRHHATVNVKDGGYYLTDCSLGGVFIDGQERVLHGDSQQIVDGMIFRIGEYEILATVDEPIHAMPLSLGEFEFTQQTSTSDFVTHEELIDAPIYQPSFESQLPAASVLSDSFIPPQVSTNPFATVEDIPENFSFEDLLADTPTPVVQSHASSVTADTEVSLDELFKPEPIVEQPITTPATNTGATDNLFAAFLRGAGVSYTPSKTETLPELMFRIGQMFRHLIKGTVILLRTRSAFKSLLRLDKTTLAHADNNPLKFTVATDEVLRQFLDNKNEGYLSSIEAIDESFDDLFHHQQAMQAGMEAAISELLRTFDPQRIEKMSDQGVMLQKKAKCWDKYHEIYHHVAEEVRMLDYFSESFARAYEQKLKSLHSKHY